MRMRVGAWFAVLATVLVGWFLPITTSPTGAAVAVRVLTIAGCPASVAPTDAEAAFQSTDLVLTEQDEDEDGDGDGPASGDGHDNDARPLPCSGLSRSSGVTLPAALAAPKRAPDRQRHPARGPPAA